MIGFRACHQNMAGNKKIITFTDKYMHVAIQIQGFQRKERKLKSLKGFLAIKSCHKPLQKHKTTGNNNSICIDISATRPLNVRIKGKNKIFQSKFILLHVLG